MSRLFERTSSYVVILLSFLFVAGCAGTFHGIKVRTQSPSKEEAFRKLSLALTADGYEPGSVNAEKLQFMTQWRALKQNEQTEQERKSGGVSLAQIELRVESRGSLYDIFLTPMIQSVEGEERVTEVGHPLREKWQRIINELVQREAREED